MNYYNENDPKAAAWLRELIRAGHIPAGDVDERSITDVKPTELSGYIQCHWFAGIGGWSLALKLAGWPDDRPVWTGSCPCQPFSSAGKRLGDKDERHLWPAWFDLIRECRPVRVFGEQVSSAIGKGWLDGVSADLETEGYACGATVLGAHSVGAPHIRARLYWMAYAERASRGTELKHRANNIDEVKDGAQGSGWTGKRGTTGGMAHSGGSRSPEQRRRREQPKGSSEASSVGGLGDTGGQGLSKRECDGGIQQKTVESHEGQGTVRTSHLGFWSDFDLLPCTDGKARRVESGLQPLAHGVPERVGLLRGYGNGIVPQVAAVFIEAAEGGLAQ